MENYPTVSWIVNRVALVRLEPFIYSRQFQYRTGPVHTNKRTHPICTNCMRNECGVAITKEHRIEGDEFLAVDHKRSCILGVCSFIGMDHFNLVRTGPQ
jgi:hypothetical protein